jgi:hypothetical protein
MELMNIMKFFGDLLQAPCVGRSRLGGGVKSQDAFSKFCGIKDV